MAPWWFLSAFVNIVPAPGPTHSPSSPTGGTRRSPELFQESVWSLRRSAAQHNSSGPFRIVQRRSPHWVYPEEHGLDVETTAKLCHPGPQVDIRLCPPRRWTGAFINLCSVTVQREHARGPMDQGKGKVHGNRVNEKSQWVCPKVKQKAFVCGELYITEGVQIADVRDHFISCLEALCRSEHRQLILKVTSSSQIPGSLPSVCTAPTSPTIFVPSIHPFIYSEGVIQAHMRYEVSIGL